MNDLNESLGALALDLNRVALGLHRGSIIMAKKFYQEALARKNEVSVNSIPAYLVKILSDLNPKQNLNNQFAETALLYSILIENFVVKNL